MAQDMPDCYDVLEIYAGHARVARLGRALGLETAALDDSYDPEKKSMNINTDAGFLFLASNEADLLWPYLTK